MASLVIPVEGFNMHIDHYKRGISSALWGQGYREPGFMWILKREAKGKLGLDIGANLGYATLHMCKGLDKVMAIEPDRRPRKLLKRNIKENNFLSKVEVSTFAVSNKNGKETIYLSKKNPNLNNLCSNEKMKAKKDFLKKEIIKTRTIDSLNVEPDFIKMDIEGYEVEAILGGLETFKKIKKCKILIEVHPQFYNDDRNFANVLRKLFDIGFNVKYVVSAACGCPDLFKERGYSPFKVMKDGDHKRGIFKNISKEDAIDFCAFKHEQAVGDKVSIKIARSIFLVKE